jgi:hypothetical protein
MNIIMFLYLATLAFVLSPGVFLRLPPGGSPVIVAFTHSLVISFVWCLTSPTVYRSTR